MCSKLLQRCVLKHASAISGRFCLHPSITSDGKYLCIRNREGGSIQKDNFLSRIFGKWRIGNVDLVLSKVDKGLCVKDKGVIILCSRVAMVDLGKSEVSITWSAVMRGTERTRVRDQNMVHELDWPHSDLGNVVVGDNGISGSQINWSTSFLNTRIYFKVRNAASESSSVLNVVTKTSGKGIGSSSASNVDIARSKPP